MNNALDVYFKSLPDPELCRTRYWGPVLRLSECLSEILANRCPYAVKFDTSYFCGHPDCRNFEEPPKLNWTSSLQGK
jgi:hypothetical protein